MSEKLTVLDVNPWDNSDDSSSKTKVVDFTAKITKMQNNKDNFDGIYKLIIGIILFLWLISGFYQVQPSEQGLVLRLGKYVETTDAGLHYHLPYPFERVYIVDVSKERSINLGVNENSFREASSSELTESHMLTGDENIVDINLTVVWNIKDAKFKGIKIIKGSVNDVEKFYYFIKKKDKHNINYYKGLFNNLNTENNKFEIYFAYMDTNEYLKNCHIALNKEKVRNEKLKQKLLKNNNESNIVYKMQSDKLVDKYDHELLKAIQLNSQYKDGTVVATVGIIKTNNIINFIVDGYDNNLKFIKASYLIKWEIIKEYLKSGYTNFNLGYLPDYQDKFKGLYLSKIGFNCNIHKEPGQYNLIINNMIYKFINIADKDKYN